MSRAEERTVLLQTGCLPSTADTLLDFADRYRSRFTGADSGEGSALRTQKNRKLGTRALVRICKRMARAPDTEDMRVLLERAVLQEFLPRTEAMSLDELLEGCNIQRKSPPVRGLRASSAVIFHYSHTSLTPLPWCQRKVSLSRHKHAPLAAKASQRPKGPCSSLLSTRRGILRV